MHFLDIYIKWEINGGGCMWRKGWNKNVMGGK